MAKATKRTTARKPKKTSAPRNVRALFLAHLRKSANVSESARVAVVDRSTVNRWRLEDPTFAEQWEDALDEATDALEAEARRRAIEGHEEYVVSMGQIVRDPKTGNPLMQRKFSDSLTTLLLKAHRPEKYRERHDIKQSGAIAINITSDDDAL